MTSKIYRNLRKHLDALPIGLPRTISHVEYKILKYLFTEREAQITMILTGNLREISTIFESAPTKILAELGINEISILESEFESLAKKGLIFKCIREEKTLYSNVPLVIGIFEFNLDNLSLKFLQNIEKYIKQGYAIELLNSQVPQLRTIPIEAAITPENYVVPYDNFRNIIANTDEIITVANCICRKSHDIDGSSCIHTKLRETCINMGEMGQRYLDIGIGREISKNEALTILEQAQRDGLILQTMNAQNPQVICACCGDCCGTLSILQALPRPVDFTSSNYYAIASEEICDGCGNCLSACHMGALKLHKDKIEINLKRCIGCGNCVPKCPPQALSLKQKQNAPLPTPQDRDDLYKEIEAKKRNKWERIKFILKAIAGRENINL